MPIAREDHNRKAIPKVMKIEPYKINRNLGSA